ncbi:uncharacterized protein LOC108601525 [Drosophila busckii]|uniref:uncharacterized protein LOC108601525 n=1 Tax=Drosophila busckii TaxID=30019 RepID=UPI00083F0FC3|nr:uncharacterized protein LOC108601525 [Drosophila busckii]
MSVASMATEESATNTWHATRQQLLLLHRQKRYLLFPEGSSFQLVFDLIIPIIDFTNYAILGITCAVAWELPSKPPSEILDNLRTRLNDGTLGILRRNDSVSQLNIGDNSIPMATNWQAMQATAATAAAAATYASHTPAYYTNVQRVADVSAYANAANGEPATKSTNWNARQSIAKWQQWQQPATTPNWWQRNKQRVQQQWSAYKPTPMPTAAPSYSYYTQRPRQLLQAPPKHRIYPVFGKRRRRRRRVAQAADADIEHLQLQQHLSSRALLYAKIERLYKTRQLNGSACVQRALCESAQRREHDEPQSFIMELLSAIFQLPTGPEAQHVLQHMPAHYLEATQQQRGNCQLLYADCQHKFWFE